MRKFFLSVAAMMALAAASAAWYLSVLQAPEPGDPAGIPFTIAAGEDLAAVAGRLEKERLIRSARAFGIMAKLRDADGSIQAGDYVLYRNSSASSILAVIKSGRTVKRERDIVLIEGWRLDDIAAYLEGELGPVGDDFLRLAGTPVADWPFAFPRPAILAEAPAGADLEGYIFPDTYRIYEDAAAADIINKALANLERKFTPEMAAAAGRKGRTVHEIMIMASVIEREVRTEEDMKIVAGIFWDRIANSQALESCATLAYILKEDKPQYTYEDTRVESPYNTYLNRGLPPGPIGNPGLQAIRAALEPTATDYNYFLSRPDTGETVFSRTYDEHLANKAKYLD